MRLKFSGKHFVMSHLFANEKEAGGGVLDGMFREYKMRSLAYVIKSKRCYKTVNKL